jgi:hypothetical protein
MPWNPWPRSRGACSPAFAESVAIAGTGVAMMPGHMGNLKDGINHMTSGSEPPPKPSESNGTGGSAERPPSNSEKPPSNPEKLPTNSEKPAVESRPAAPEQLAPEQLERARDLGRGALERSEGSVRRGIKEVNAESLARRSSRNRSSDVSLFRSRYRPSCANERRR